MDHTHFNISRLKIPLSDLLSFAYVQEKERRYGRKRENYAKAKIYAMWEYEGNVYPSRESRY